jgi:hypothetical protein
MAGRVGHFSIDYLVNTSHQDLVPIVVQAVDEVVDLLFSDP